ncbi:UNVERIFIED_CONTAM: hypothetical protein PYX00_010138 [Menopon gallinae]|uniref:Bardet-Biedl syndrome 1 n=1 Tax=Menopon gallinae TaxID=328185 RepID=A0AAW2HE54_9NEOP
MDYARSAHRWLDAYTDPRASLYTFTRCMSLADLQSDGDFKLVLVDLGTGSSNIKLKVYKGTSLVNETTLLEIPAGVVTFYNELREPKYPAIAIASGSNIFIYKNMKPYFKISAPKLYVNPLEVDVWIQARNGEITSRALYDMIVNIKNEIGFSNLSWQSQKFLMLSPENAEELESVKNSYSPHPIERQVVITCMTTLFKSMNTKNAISCIVFGTENGDIYIVDSEAFTVLDSVNQSEDLQKTDHTVPVVMKTTGLYDVDYRIVTCNRNGKVTLLRKGWTQVKVLIHLSVHVVDMCLLSETGNIIIANMNSTLECYTKKGRKLWNVKLQTHIMGLLPVTLSHLSLTLIAVALSGGTIQFYNGRQLVDTIVAADTIAGMIFGQFGQEDHCLILVTISGILQVKMLKRTAQFNVPGTCGSTSSANQNIKLPITKKTKVFLEHSQREKDNYIQMHQTFQKELHRLRLTAARQFADSLRKTNNLISNDSKLPMKLSAQVFGLGPTFKILLTLENMSPTSENVSTLVKKKLSIKFHYNEKIYDVERPYIQVPFLVPGLSYKFETIVRTVVDAMISDEIHVFVSSSAETTPILSAAVYMPVCDVLPVEI